MNFFFLRAKDSRPLCTRQYAQKAAGGGPCVLRSAILPYKAQSNGQPINDLCGMGDVVDNTH